MTKSYNCAHFAELASSRYPITYYLFLFYVFHVAFPSNERIRMEEYQKYTIWILEWNAFLDCSIKTDGTYWTSHFQWFLKNKMEQSFSKMGATIFDQATKKRRSTLLNMLIWDFDSHDTNICNVLFLSITSSTNF